MKRSGEWEKERNNKWRHGEELIEKRGRQSGEKRCRESVIGARERERKKDIERV